MMILRSPCTLALSLKKYFLQGVEDFSTVKIVNPLPALKRLSIIFCFDLESVEVRDSNLVYLMYRGSRHIKHFLLKNVPLLVEMNLGGLATRGVEEFLAKFSSYLPQLEKLMIEKRNMLSIMEADMICSSVNLSNLKQFVWKFEFIKFVKNLEAVAVLVGAMPLLQRLVVMTYGDLWKGHLACWYNFRKDYTRAHTHTYSNLKQVEFVGYHGNVDEMAMVVHFLEKAVALEEVIIHLPKETCVDNEFGEYTKQEIDTFRAFAKEPLTTIVPLTVTLKILGE